MKQITRFYKELNIAHLKALGIVSLVGFLLFPNYVPIKSSGDNMYTVSLNGKVVGVTSDYDRAKKCLKEARNQLASANNELALVDADLEVSGEELLWGSIDSDKQIRSAMKKVLEEDLISGAKHGYTVKIDDYIINLETAEEVTSLLQAALDKYQEKQSFQVSLVLDPTRELNVLTTSVISKEEAKQELFELPKAGVATALAEMTKDIERAGEKSFDDFSYGLIAIEYGDKVEVVESYLPAVSIMNIDEAIAQVTKDQEVNAVYEVQAGDTLSEIAIATNVPLDKLIELNDSLEDENSTIRVGEELIITMPEPTLSVNRQEEVYYEEDYEAEVEYVYNDDWYTTDSQVLREPSAGHRNVAALVSYHNDKVTNTEILKEEITYPAVAKVIEIGTKIPPTYIKPISGGRLSSGFGRRNAPTRGASTYHKGIDWATPVGTAVWASSAGVVSRAGWGSGYGYVVYIDHTDGRQTRYGHLSKVLVKPGQHVKQGDKIALSGNTGRSTGAHLHFEILIGGSQVNPLNYLN